MCINSMPLYLTGSCGVAGERLADLDCGTAQRRTRRQLVPQPDASDEDVDDFVPMSPPATARGVRLLKPGAKQPAAEHAAYRYAQRTSTSRQGLRAAQQRNTAMSAPTASNISAADPSSSGVVSVHSGLIHAEQQGFPLLGPISEPAATPVVATAEHVAVQPVAQASTVPASLAKPASVLDRASAEARAVDVTAKPRHRRRKRVAYMAGLPALPPMPSALPLAEELPTVAQATRKEL